MKKVFVLLALVVVAFAVVIVSTVLAGPTNFVAHLAGSEEVPTVDTRAQGQAVFHLNGDALDYKLIASNILNINQAHIHCGAGGVNGPVVAFLYPASAPPVLIPGRSDGVLREGTITNLNVIPRPDSAACPGGVADFDDLINIMQSGNAYVNVHTSANPGGEIRGQVRLAGRPR